jgi:hypothetical protein
MNSLFHMGVVEDRNDPLTLGRVRVRIVGVHTEDKSILPTDDLPWAYIMQPVSSAATSGVGTSPVGPVPGTWVCVQFMDPDKQYPIVIGSLSGIPQYEKTAGGDELYNKTQEKNFDVSENGEVTKSWDQYNTEDQMRLMEFSSPGTFFVDDTTRKELENSEFLIEAKV